MTEDDRLYIARKVDELNQNRAAIAQFKQAHPECKAAYSPQSAGSILNAYSEGDLSFEEAKLAIERLSPADDDIYIPGDWICPACHFILHERSLYVVSGDIGVNRNAPNEECPNHCGPLQRLKWKQDATAANQTTLDLIKQVRWLQSEVDRLLPRN